MTTQLQLEQVSFAPGRSLAQPKKGQLRTHYLLRDLSFSVAKGERIAIVGASGSGKTSLLRLLNRLSDPTQGKIYLEGRSLQDIPVIQLRQQVLYVASEPKLLGMTVREALSYPLRLRNDRDLEAKVRQGCDRYKIPQEWLDRNEVQLSTGERQWVSIVRALLCDSPILLLDEPTTSIDVGRSDQLLAILASRQDQTILVATHDFAWAARFAARVLQLQQGALVQDSDRVDWKEVREAIVQIEATEAAAWE